MPADSLDGRPDHPHTVVPAVKAIVLAQVIRVSPVRGVDCMIFAVARSPPIGEGDTAAPVQPVDFVPYSLPYPALIQPAHVRSLQSPPIKIHDLMRPNDVIRARVLSLGDGTQFYLSTAGTEYGVVMARGQTGGGWMAPLNWQEMEDVRSGGVEPRKVARPLGRTG